MKTFEVRSSFFSTVDNDALGGREVNRHNQGSIFVQAARKADAIATFQKFGYTVKPADCRVGMGNDMDALLEAGVITDDSLTFLSLNGRRVAKVVFNDEGERVSAGIGIIRIDRSGGNYRSVFEAV